jgi:hypothetical protein
MLIAHRPNRESPPSRGARAVPEMDSESALLDGDGTVRVASPAESADALLSSADIRNPPPSARTSFTGRSSVGKHVVLRSAPDGLSTPAISSRESLRESSVGPATLSEVQTERQPRRSPCCSGDRSAKQTSTHTLPSASDRARVLHCVVPGTALPSRRLPAKQAHILRNAVPGTTNQSLPTPATHRAADTNTDPERSTANTNRFQRTHIEFIWENDLANGPPVPEPRTPAVRWFNGVPIVYGPPLPQDTVLVDPEQTVRQASKGSSAPTAACDVISSAGRDGTPILPLPDEPYEVFGLGFKYDSHPPDITMQVSFTPKKPLRLGWEHLYSSKGEVVGMVPFDDWVKMQGNIHWSLTFPAEETPEYNRVRHFPMFLTFERHLVRFRIEEGKWGIANSDSALDLLVAHPGLRVDAERKLKELYNQLIPTPHMETVLRRLGHMQYLGSDLYLRYHKDAAPRDVCLHGLQFGQPDPNGWVRVAPVDSNDMENGNALTSRNDVARQEMLVDAFPDNASGTYPAPVHNGHGFDMMDDAPQTNIDNTAVPQFSQVSAHAGDHRFVDPRWLILSLDALARREGIRLDGMPPGPEAQRDPAHYGEAVTVYNTFGTVSASNELVERKPDEMWDPRLPDFPPMPPAPPRIASDAESAETQIQSKHVRQGKEASPNAKKARLR